MTVKISISLPDDIAEWLSRQRNTSATVTEAVRARMDDEEEGSRRRRAAVAAYAAYLAENPIPGMDELDAATNEASQHGNAW